ncbi:SagB/ThcOx family dehydrogenase [Schaalia sp. JY-X169]|uniref:SagB/ThcOx family dehydrogenase n=1 Tax=Schaalia sp. JY-X169 TaxID=2758572 RepID=UPI0015F5BEDD|nr:SagB/ThcOx family dehydrogenase [Schaalia sp. JY-X169]
MRTRHTRAMLTLGAAALALTATSCAGSAVNPEPPEPPTTIGAPLELPAPTGVPAASLNDTIDERHSVRAFSAQPLTQEGLATLLWATYGYRSDGGRTIPSAGGLYALTIFIAIGDVEDVPPGVYIWDPARNQLGMISTDDPRTDLEAAALNQTAIGDAPVTIAIAGSPLRLEERYAERAEQFTVNEAGHASQNLLLMATALGLAAVPIGGFEDDRVSATLELPAGEVPYYLVPVGTPAS